MASMLVATGAMAAGENATLTTKNYVDSGLRAVYQKAQSAETKAAAAQTAAENNAAAITNIQNKLGDGETSGLIKDVADLQSAVADVDYSGKADKADLEALSETVAGHTTSITNLQDNKADKTALDTLSGTVAGKADASTVNTLSETVAGKADQTALDALQQQVNGIDTTAYTGTNGVAIDANHQVGLNVNATAGNMYVYTSNGWEPLPVEDTWDASILTSGN